MSQVGSKCFEKSFQHYSSYAKYLCCTFFSSKKLLPQVIVLNLCLFQTMSDLTLNLESNAKNFFGLSDAQGIFSCLQYDLLISSWQVTWLTNDLGCMIYSNILWEDCENNDCDNATTVENHIFLHDHKFHSKMYWFHKKMNNLLFELKKGE